MQAGEDRLYSSQDPNKPKFDLLSRDQNIRMPAKRRVAPARWNVFAAIHAIRLSKILRADRGALPPPARLSLRKTDHRFSHRSPIDIPFRV
jgi:hypothetical protein